MDAPPGCRIGARHNGSARYLEQLAIRGDATLAGLLHACDTRSFIPSASWSRIA